MDRRTPPTSPRVVAATLALLFAYAGCQSTPELPTPESPTPELPTPVQPAPKPFEFAPDTPKLRLGSWNLEHFGQRDKFQDRADAPKNRTPEQVQAIAKFIQGMQVDVLALQEIGGPEPLQNLLGLLGDQYRYCLGTTGVYDDTRISVGFLWNSDRVDLVQCEEMADFPRTQGEMNVFHRKPVNAVFRARSAESTSGGGLDFRAIVVHLKASRGRNNEQKRMAEVSILRQYIAQLQSDPNEDQDIVVLGDFNHTLDAPAHRTFRADDFVVYAMPTEASTDVPSPTIVWFDDPIDHIALTQGIRNEVVPGSFRRHNQLGRYDAAAKDKITPVELEWRVTYSDHYPVTLDLWARPDLDPQATFAKPKHPLPIGAAK